MEGTLGEILFATFSLIVVIIMITAAIIGYGYSRVTVVQRIICVMIGAFLIVPFPYGWSVVFQGLTIIFGVLMIVLHVRNSQSIMRQD